MRLRPAALDLCAGTGVLAVAMARSVPATQVAAVEKKRRGVPLLQHNCAALAPRTVAVQADVFGYENVLAPQSVDVIVSNPPYVTAQEYRPLRRSFSSRAARGAVAQRKGLALPPYRAGLFSCSEERRGTCIQAGSGQAQRVAALLHRGWVHGRFCALRCRRPAALRICRKTVKRVQKRRMFIAFARGFRVY